MIKKFIEALTLLVAEMNLKYIAVVDIKGNTMASRLSRLATFIMFLTLIFSFNGVSGDDKGILSRLYKQASQENRPLVLVLDNSDTENLNGLLNPKVSQSIEMRQQMRDPLKDLYEMIQLNKKRSAFQLLESKLSVDEDRFDRDRRRPRNRNRKQRFRQWGNKIRLDDQYNRNRYRENQDLSVETQDFFKNGKDRYMQPRDMIGSNKKSMLRSPFFQSFLRISSSLRCAARDECADDCSDKFAGNKKDKCEEKCEDKYECPEPTPDPCERGECDESDECGQDECNVSTKGITLVTETPKCKRC